MNTGYVRIMLKDAARNLRHLLEELSDDPEFSEVEFSVLLNEIYGSLNTAWNGRDQADSEAANIDEETYYRLRSFPVRDIIMDGS